MGFECATVRPMTLGWTGGMENTKTKTPEFDIETALQNHWSCKLNNVKSNFSLVGGNWKACFGFLFGVNGFSCFHPEEAPVIEMARGDSD